MAGLTWSRGIRQNQPMQEERGPTTEEVVKDTLLTSANALRQLDSYQQFRADRLYKPNENLYYDSEIGKYMPKYTETAPDTGIIRDMTEKPVDRYEISQNYKNHLESQSDAGTLDMNSLEMVEQDAIKKDMPELYTKATTPAVEETTLAETGEVLAETAGTGGTAYGVGKGTVSAVPALKKAYKSMFPTIGGTRGTPGGIGLKASNYDLSNLGASGSNIGVKSPDFLASLGEGATAAGTTTAATSALPFMANVFGQGGAAATGAATGAGMAGGVGAAAAGLAVPYLAMAAVGGLLSELFGGDADDVFDLMTFQ